MPTLMKLDAMQDDVCDVTPRVIVAREGTELADSLRAAGWIPRAGWRSMTSEGQTVWHLRFEIDSDDE